MNITMLEQNTDVLRRTAGKWIDKRLVLLTAAQFAARQKEIDEKEFIEMSSRLKKSGSVFSPLRTIHFPMAGLLLSAEREQDEVIAELQRKYDTLRSAGLRSSPYTYIAAFLLNPSTRPERIKEIYTEMRRYHAFLTSHEDYPASVIMANRPESVTELVDASESYYRFLNENGFWKGNDLQFLANMLVMNGLYEENTAQAVLNAKREFESSGLKIKGMHYPALGIAALSGNIKECVGAAIELRNSPVLKWSKDMAVTLASIFASQAMIESSAGLTAAVQAMIQAQQAVMAASTAGAVTASSSSG
ncbi:DUF4003 family protein [Domibacillus indicus]|uniref:DUF4003 family protein n=1 Tax=Domibacillus indicus TaxID=1437523 RepID=UPI000617ADC2|nr:DUF4003 family protein [Domibacillus indicus]